MAEPTQDLNQVIASAVQARIETEVFAALASSEVIAQFVTSALRQPITVRDPDTYRDRQTTFLTETVAKAIQAATEAAVRKVVAEEAPAIEAEVTKEMRKNVRTMAAQLVGSVTEAVKSPYGVKVELMYPGRNS